MHNHKSNLEKNTAKLAADGILNSDSINFYSEIFDFQFTAYARWNELAAFPQIESDTEGSVFLRSISADSPARELLSENCRSICAIIKKYNPGMELSHLIEIMCSAGDTTEKAISAILEKNPAKIEILANASRIGMEEFLFIIINWLKPLFIALREKHYAPDPDAYKGGSCPFCGYYPDMGLYAGEKENKRYLHCQLCEDTWPYKRLACAVCGTEEKDKLEYFSDEANERYRVDACHNCKGFLKSVRLDKFEELESCDITVENILTLSLDAEMLNRGFNKL